MEQMELLLLDNAICVVSVSLYKNVSHVRCAAVNLQDLDIFVQPCLYASFLFVRIILRKKYDFYAVSFLSGLLLFGILKQGDCLC